MTGILSDKAVAHMLKCAEEGRPLPPGAVVAALRQLIALRREAALSVRRAEQAKADKARAERLERLRRGGATPSTKE